MAHVRKDVTDAELAVLEVLWDRGKATIREMADVLYPRGGTAHYATVQKLLERLEAKGCVRRRREVPAHVFAATVDRDTLVSRQLRSVAEKLCGGSMSSLVTHLVRTKGLSAEERKALRALLNETSRGNASRGKQP
jgi:predicted transcriptional regulator